MEIGRYDEGSVSSLSCFNNSEMLASYKVGGSLSDSIEWENILCKIGVI